MEKLTRKQAQEMRAANIAALIDAGALDKCFVKGGTKDENGKMVNCGLYGRLAELETHGPKSKKTDVARQGENDCYPVINGTPHGVERKTGGGEVDFDRIKKQGYIIYSTAPGQSQMWGHDVPPIIMKAQTFFDTMVFRIGKKKSTGNGGGTCNSVQVNSKKAYLRIQEGLASGKIQLYVPGKKYVFAD